MRDDTHTVKTAIFPYGHEKTYRSCIAIRSNDLVDNCMQLIVICPDIEL